MRIKIAAISLFALGMAMPAFAQSNPAPTDMTIDKSTEDAGGGANTATSKSTVVDPNATNSTSTVAKDKCMKQGEKGSLQTQGGNSGASQSEACIEDNN